jgi:acetyltransferase
VATDPTLAATVYRAFDGEDELHTIIYARKALTGDAGTQAAANLADAVGETPLAVYAMDGAITGAEAETYRACDIPVFASVHDLARAIDGLAAWREATPSRPRGDAPLGPLGDGKAALREAGIPLAGEALVHDAEAAVAAAERIGYPIVMKLEDARVAHKTEAGGVLVGIEDAATGYAKLEAVTQRLFGTAPEAILLQEQVAAGIELILGVKVDPGFGPFVLAGAGGVLTEVLADSVLRPAPVTRETALKMIGELRVSRLLSGYRGAPPADVGALADAIVALSEIAWQRRDSLVEADLNPVIVLPEGVRVVDVLMVER